VENLFRRVRLAVYDATEGRQTPWDTSSLTTEFRFYEAGPAARAPLDATAPSATPRAGLSAVRASRPSASALRGLSPADAYRTALAWDRPDTYRSYLEAHPDAPQALQAHRLLDLRVEEIAWAEATRAGDSETFSMFARIYPSSSHAAEAKRLAATAPSRNQARVAAACPIPADPRRRTDLNMPLGSARSVRVTSRPSQVLSTRQVPRLPRTGDNRPRRAVDSEPGPATDLTSDAGVPPSSFQLPAVERWRGFYLGLHGGYGRQDGNVRTGGFGPTDSVAVSINAGNVPGALPTSSESGIGGGQAGLNWQIGPIMVGAETDIAYMGLGRRSTVAVNPFGVLVTTQAEQRLNFMGTVRARAGLAFGDFLLFGTGGLAYGGVEQRASIVPSPSINPTYSGSRSEVAVGWAVGGGGEYAIGPALSLKVDFLHYDLGARTLALSERTGLAPGEFATIRGGTRGEVVRFGFNAGF
jgi:opacity protein-like surface antigen